MNRRTVRHTKISGRRLSYSDYVRIRNYKLWLKIKKRIAEETEKA